VNGGVAILRASQYGHQCAHAVQVEVSLGQFGGMFQAIIYEGIQVVKGVVVGGFDIHERHCKAEFGIRKLGIRSNVIASGFAKQSPLVRENLVE
jgi:hypothetical protein